jgi:cytoskeletal protein CcmA (bactofilin family)
MPPAKPALKREPTAAAKSEDPGVLNATAAASGPRRLQTGQHVTQPTIRPVAAQPPARKERGNSFQARVPVIIGEATYRGLIPVDGIISGQLGANGSALSIKQRPRNGTIESQPELNGEIGFKDMLRVNGHIAGRVFSFKGTLIIDTSARVEAQIDVAVCVINGTVNGDVVGHERVELGPGAVINGNISTRSIGIKPGAIFQGDCRMLKNENDDQ